MSRTYGKAQDLIDFTRASGATYLDSDGVLKTASNNIPRIEYDADGNLLGLLVEESRTNLAPYSEPKVLNLGTSAEVSDGDFGGSLDLANGIHFGDNSVNRYAYSQTTTTAGIDYTFSVFVKMDDGSEPNVSNPTNGDFSIVISGSVVTVLADISVTPMGNNVYRVSGTRTTTIVNSNNGIIKYTSQSSKGFTITGFQIEQASFPTSYIKTSGSTATRSADVASLSTSAFGYNADAGSLIAEGKYLARNVTNRYGRVVGLATATTERFGVYDDPNSTTEYVRYYARSDSATAILGPDNLAGSDELNVKIGFGFAKDNLLISGGGEQASSSSGTFATDIAKLWIGSETGNSQFINGHIKSIKYIPRRLTNAQLQELTS